MALTVSDILHNADLFRRTYPSWPHAEPEEAPVTTMREVPAPTRGSGPVECCGGHRKRCLFGDIHHWGTWYENAKLQRTRDTYYCHKCGGVCTADEEG